MFRWRSPLLAVLSASGLLAPAIRAQAVLFEVKGFNGGASAGDWDGDGVGDFAVASPYDDKSARDAGAVSVVSGSDESVLQTWYGRNASDYFGTPVAMPDVDGDGKDEVLVLVPWSDVGGPDLGSAYLFAGGSGTRLWRVDGTWGLLGQFGGPTRDFDGDGAPDVYLAEYLELHVVSG